MGGGVALCLLDVAPERVASLTMVSAIGVQEMELTGDYYVNHAVHGAQLAALWAMREGTPHMGLLDDAMLGVPYARNFFDSDQRPLRAILRRITVPTLIVHGIDDPQVPIDVAREHHRLVPQSELLALAGDHFLVFTEATYLGGVIAAFVQRVAEGQAPARADADPERVRAAGLPFDPMRLPQVRGIAAIVFGGVLAIGGLLSESVTSVAAGMFVARGRVSLGLAMTACLAGVFLAGALSSFRGRAVRRPTLAVLAVASAVRTVAFVGAGVVASWLLFRIPSIAAMTPYVRAALVVAVVTGAAEARPRDSHPQAAPTVGLDLATSDTLGILAAVDVLSTSVCVSHLPDAETQKHDALHRRESRRFWRAVSLANRSSPFFRDSREPASMSRAHA